MGKIACFVIVGMISLLCFLLSYMYFLEKGYLLNNAYLYASKEERQTMNKKPHYKQSAIVFLLLGIVLLITAIDLLLQTSWLIYGEFVLIIMVVIYAIVSSVRIEKNTK